MQKHDCNKNDLSKKLGSDQIDQCDIRRPPTAPAPAPNDKFYKGTIGEKPGLDVAEKFCNGYHANRLPRYFAEPKSLKDLPILHTLAGKKFGNLKIDSDKIVYGGLDKDPETKFPNLFLGYDQYQWYKADKHYADLLKKLIDLRDANETDENMPSASTVNQVMKIFEM